jgi:hypothetical protein
MRAPVEDEFVKTLTAATYQFIVERGVAELLRATVEDVHGIRPVSRMQAETLPEANRAGDKVRA